MYGVYVIQVTVHCILYSELVLLTRYKFTDNLQEIVGTYKIKVYSTLDSLQQIVATYNLQNIST